MAFDIALRNPGATFNILLGGTSSSSSSSRSSSSSSRSSSSSLTGGTVPLHLAYWPTLNALTYKTANTALCSGCCKISSSSSSSRSSSSSSSVVTEVHGSGSGSLHGGGGFVFPDYDLKNIDALYEKYSPSMKDKTQLEKEDYLIQLVSSGAITADQALMLAIREKIDLTS